LRFLVELAPSVNHIAKSTFVRMHLINVHDKQSMRGLAWDLLDFGFDWAFCVRGPSHKGSKGRHAVHGAQGAHELAAQHLVFSCTSFNNNNLRMHSCPTSAQNFILVSLKQAMVSGFIQKRVVQPLVAVMKSGPSLLTR
jgi:hypothetical protein